MRSRKNGFSFFALYAVLVSSFLFSSCSSQPSLTPEQKQMLQSRFLSGLAYKDLFQAVVDLMKQSGYQTTSVDVEQGVVIGSIRANDPLEYTTRFGRDSHLALRQGERIEAVVNLKSVDPENVSVRISMQLMPEYSLGVVRGEEITDPKAYQRFFTQLQQLIKKRSARKGSSSNPSNKP